MTKEQQKATIQALLQERHGYELRVVGAEEDGNEEALAAATERIKQVDAELRKLGHEASKPASRASRRPSGQAASKR